MADLDLLEPDDIETDEVVEDEAEVLSLEDIAQSGQNLALGLDDQTLNRIASVCLEGYERDETSRGDWLAEYDAALDAIGTSEGARQGPFDGCYDAKYPLIDSACLQFNANAYPALVMGEKVVKGLVSGDDPEGHKQARADRISDHMSYQLLEEMPEWETETDTLLIHLPASGMAFRQYSWDEQNQRPRSEFLTARNLVVNQNCRDLETVPLYTKLFERYPYQITEAMFSEEYVKCDVSWEGDHDEAPQRMLECHLRHDLDGDGYPEPYVVVIHKESQRVLSIKADFWPQDIGYNDEGKVRAVRRRNWIAVYRFIPDPKGGFYGIGFGRLLRSHNAIINSILNQLLDSATLQNAGGGFIGNQVRLDGGVMDVEPGEWKMVPISGQALAQNIVPLPAPGPSAAMFQLLGLMIDQGKDLAQQRDALTGDVPPNTQPTTLMALIEQGAKVYNVIQKRVFRGAKAEFGMIFDLNGAFLPEKAYYRVLDSQRAIVREDYAQDCDVRPVSDPAVTTAPQRLAKAQFLSGYQDDPLMDPVAMRRRIFEAAQIPDTDQLFKKQDAEDPGLKMAQEAAATSLAKEHAEIENKNADTRNKLADAEKTELEGEEVRRRLALGDAASDQARVDHATQTPFGGGLEGMGQPSGDEEGFAGGEPEGGPDQGGMDPSLLGAGDGIGAEPDGGEFPQGQGPDGGGVLPLQPEGIDRPGGAGPEPVQDDAPDALPETLMPEDDQ